MVNDAFVVKELAFHCVYYDPAFLSKQQAQEYYDDLRHNIKWEKTFKINRWVSLFHELRGDNVNYKYRDAPGAAHVGFTATIQKMQQLAQEWYHRETGRQADFNVCLLNFYEDGSQAIGWHSDREEIGRTTPIASISLGAKRTFHVRSKDNGTRDRAKIDLQSGSMVVMENECQEKYLHSVPRQMEVSQGRINVTFRCKEEGLTTAGEKEHEQHDNFMENITQGALPHFKTWYSAEINKHANHTCMFGDDVCVGDLPTEYPCIHVLAKTNVGAERYCGAEIQEMLEAAQKANIFRVVAKPCGLDGYVALATSKETLPHSVFDEFGPRLVKLRSAHHVLRHHFHFHLKECTTQECPTPANVNGEAVYCYFKNALMKNEVAISSFDEIDGEGTFRVSCDRIGGPHAFNHPQLAAEMGGAISEYYGPRIKPKMEDYQVHLRADVTGYWVVVGTQLNLSDMSKERHFLQYRNMVTIKTNLAYAMVRLGNIKKGDCLVDPFCGSGTILLEALDIFDRQLNCIGLDVAKRSTDGARENAKAEGYNESVCKFICSDARGLRRYLSDETVDALVSNLPWGVRTGDKNVSDLKTMYEIFLRTSWYLLKPGARIVMLVLRGLQITRILRKLGGRYKLLSVNVVRTTNNLPCIVVVEKLPLDELTDNIKGQLAYMNQYVNVSPEIYQALHDEDVDE